ncbi:MAG TPA: hypothetical protein VIK61_02005 [Acidimicrobiia bacterium]
MNLMQRALRIAVAGGMVAGISVAIAGPAAHAATTDQSCSKVTGTVTISPGLTTTSASNTFTIKAKTSGCSAAGKGTGKISGKFTANAACQTFPNPFNTTLKTKWADLTTSTVKATFNVDTSTLQATVTGTVTKGAFKGDAISNKQQYTLANGDCVSTPVTKITLKQLSNLVFSH